MHVFIASDLFLGDWQKSIKEVKVCSGLSTLVLVEEEEEASYITEHRFFVLFWNKVARNEVWKGQCMFSSYHDMKLW